MRTKIRLDDNVGTVRPEIERRVVAAIIQISRLLDHYSLARDLVQLRQRFQLVSVVLYLVHHPLGRIVIEADRYRALSNGRVLQNVERSIRNAVQIDTDVEPLGYQFHVVQKFDLDSIVHYQIIDTVLVEFYLEWFAADQLSHFFLRHVHSVVVSQINALPPRVCQVTAQPVGSFRPAEQVHGRVVELLHPVVVHRGRGDVHLDVENVFRPVFPHALVDRHLGN